MTAYYYDLRDGKQVNFVHLAVGEEWEIGLLYDIAETPKTTVDNPNVATVIGERESSLNCNWRVKFKGVGPGNSLVRCRDPRGAEIALTQLVVRKPVAPVTYVNGPKTGNMWSFLDASKIAPNTNAELILTLKVFLQQSAVGSTVTDSNGKTFTAMKWTPQAWGKFVQAFKAQGQRAWDGKFWLATPSQYFPLVKSGFRHNVYCRLKLEVVPTAADAHRTITVARVASDIRSNGGLTVGLFDQFDIRKSRYVQNGRIYTQVTIEHELGHMLGIDHIGTLAGVAGCTPGDQGATNCYCVASNDCGDMMGMGHALSVRDAVPWKERIAMHTGTGEGDWAVSLKRLAPVKL
jgi:hypothetical protein